VQKDPSRAGRREGGRREEKEEGGGGKRRRKEEGGVLCAESVSPWASRPSLRLVNPMSIRSSIRSSPKVRG